MISGGNVGNIVLNREGGNSRRKIDSENDGDEFSATTNANVAQLTSWAERDSPVRYRAVSFF